MILFINLKKKHHEDLPMVIQKLSDYCRKLGAEGKTYEQIAGIPDSYILADGIETPYRCKLPLWVIGFLY